MARNRLPTAQLESSGAFAHDPQRRAARENEPVPAGPLGDPPTYLDDMQQRCWLEVASYVPEGVLTVSDRLLVEKTARLLAREREGEPLKAAEHNLMIRCFSLMGMTPADRSKINVGKPKKRKNKFEEFAQGPDNVQ